LAAVLTIPRGASQQFQLRLLLLLLPLLALLAPRLVLLLLLSPVSS
jgi:hypothetical protein